MVAEECEAGSLRSVIRRSSSSSDEKLLHMAVRSTQASERELALDYRLLGDLLMSKGERHKAELAYARSAALMRWRGAPEEVKLPLPPEVVVPALP
jgi:hypothetical protein